LDERLVPAGPIAGVFAELSAQFWDQPHLSAELIDEEVAAYLSSW
jgi:hypothetical protein